MSVVPGLGSLTAAGRKEFTMCRGQAAAFPISKHVDSVIERGLGLEGELGEPAPRRALHVDTRWCSWEQDGCGDNRILPYGYNQPKSRIGGGDPGGSRSNHKSQLLAQFLY